MTHLIVTDLQKDKKLDTQAMLSVKGGYSAITVSKPFTFADWFRMPRTPSAIFGLDALGAISKGLSNVNVQVVQLNLAIGSQNVVQSNSNLVFVA